MKANELMIGDWVRCTDPKPFKVEQIDGVEEQVYGDDGFYVDTADLQPIPLTEEIVEDRSCPNVSIYWDDRKTEETGENWYEVMIHTENSVSMLNIRYIHELQHALRLYGIEKEININIESCDKKFKKGGDNA